MNEIKSKSNDLTNQPDFAEMIKKIEALKKSGTVDLSTEEDLSIAVMNLVSLEEHFFFTAVKTNQDQYFDLLDEVRQTRKLLLAKLIDWHEGETWCISKHLLATTMRLIEVGTKLHADKKFDEAKVIFNQAQKMYTLFWGLRLKLIDTAGLKKSAASEQPWTLKNIVDKLVDCCEE